MENCMNNGIKNCMKNWMKNKCITMSLIDFKLFMEDVENVKNNVGVIG